MENGGRGDLFARRQRLDVVCTQGFFVLSSCRVRRTSRVMTRDEREGEISSLAHAQAVAAEIQNVVEILKSRRVCGECGA